MVLFQHIHGMDTTITQKQYQQLLERQDSLEGKLKELFSLVKTEPPEEEVREDYKVKLDKWHNEIVQGKGRTFSSAKAIKQFFKSLA